ncbi:MAG: lytic transglycosylase domain-containing protein, partial [Pseudomonadota bacterium]
MAALEHYIANAVRHWSRVMGVSIDPALVRAVIQQESSGGRVDMSLEPGGRRSYGPMMVLDSTARGYGVSDPTRLREPGLGIWYGVRVLGDELRRFGGDVGRALAAYNGGPRAGRGTPGAFSNQTYVNTVLGYYRQFRAAALPALALL